MSYLFVLAYGLGLLGVVWFAIDSSRIPAPVWYWSGYSRAGWWTAAIACLAALGIPALILAFVWRLGEARRSLRRELAELRDSARGSRGSHMSKGSVA